MIQQQSLKAFEVIKKDLSKRQAEVLSCIFRLGEASDKQISKYLGLPINSITPRRNELEKKNRIYCRRIDLDGIGNMKVAIWGMRGGFK